MNLSWHIAKRYLFSRKSTNAINIITGISVFGIAMGAAALVLVLSVFNGFEDLITGMYNNFNPDVRITPASGKTFEADTALVDKLRSIYGVEAVSQSLEEVAFFEYDNNQDFGTLKGVDDNYAKVTRIDSTVKEGQFRIKDGQRALAVLGLGMRNRLGVNIDNLFAPVNVYMPKRESVGAFEQPFAKRFAYPVGTFVIQQDFDNQYVITTIDFARELLGFDNEVSALELRLYPGFDIPSTYEAIQAAMGPDFVVKNRYQQEEGFFRLMKIEKWLSFAIVSLMMLMVAFNMIGALWMIVLEKQRDIAILKAMGANDNSVRNIFLSEGLLLCLFGLLLGYLIALTLYALQKTIGIIRIPGDFIIEAYPISLRAPDFAVVALTVIAIGLLASLPPALRAKRVPAMVREE
ncbi:MAG: ABC transporter permease [Saprospiraceae bacterium]|nr:ABC transporter permease [Saprospiraceae bacterium]